MKNYILIMLLVSVTALLVAFRSKEQEHGKPAYATVFYSTANKTIDIYYGSAKSRETIEIRRGENIQDRIMDTLNDLGKQDYVLVSSDINAIQSEKVFNSTEFYYTLIKR